MLRIMMCLWLSVVGGAALAVEPGGVEIVAHRGASFDAPENTVSAMKLAWEQGADGAEFDIYLTRDGKIVACHDKDLKRTAGSERLIVASTLDDLRKLEVGSWKNPKFAGEKIPTLAEMLATVPKGKKVYIEVKCGPEIVPELLRELTAADLPPALTPVICFNSNVIAAVKKARPALPSYWLVDVKKEPNVDKVIQTARTIRADGLDLSAKPELTKDYAARIKAAGFRLDVWTVNDVEVAKRMIDLGVQGLTTDRPAWLREQLAKP